MGSMQGRWIFKLGNETDKGRGDDMETAVSSRVPHAQPP